MHWTSYFLFAALILGAILDSQCNDLDSTADPEQEVDCELDHHGSSNQILDRCLKTGENFLEKYVKNLRKKKEFDTCREFAKFEECVSPLVAKCPTIRRQLQTNWMPIVDQLKCACHNDSVQASTVCRESVQCFESEFKSILSLRCHDMYKFNVKQQTRHRCHFLAKKIHCGYGLVESRCGSQAGDFAFHVSRQSELKQIRRGFCRIIKDPEYPTFRYDNRSCPQTFLKDMDQCLHENLDDDNMLYFSSENDLVAEGNARSVKKACGEFKKYRHCTRPIRKQCKDGTSLAFQYMEVLRTYNMKLDYICGDNKTAYINNLQCYQDVVKNKTYMQCDKIWSELRPLLDNLTAQQFYCQKDDKHTQRLQSKLDRLTACYKEVFSFRCGDEGGEVFSDLIRTALQDPFYLRFGYQPFCETHRELSQPEDSTNQPPVVRTHRPRSNSTPTPRRDKPIRRTPKSHVDRVPNADSSKSRNDLPSSAAAAHVRPVVFVVTVVTALNLNYFRR